MLNAAQEAINNRDKERLVAEIQSSGDPDQIDKYGRSLLMWAAIEGDAELVEILVKCGASINHRDKKIHIRLSTLLPKISGRRL